MLSAITIGSTCDRPFHLRQRFLQLFDLGVERIARELGLHAIDELLHAQLAITVFVKIREQLGPQLLAKGFLQFVLVQSPAAVDVYLGEEVSQLLHASIGRCHESSKSNSRTLR
eukprot:TRINITY_DN17031_c0_g1_i4.p1 TRINITY_DN17031_c0_g1~~TRINITY_DN17031_c0_g1_i4.p1  ORF type:complete len:114 (-),score=17.82 TRINITY_DN17031_c0_g1_i4:4-345(-)